FAGNTGLANQEKVLPDAIGNLTQLEQIALDFTEVSGSFRNGWGGELPASMSNLVNLRSFRIGGNAFTGTFPDLSGATGMQTFVITFNRFERGFPRYGLEGAWPNINAFNVSWNQVNWEDASFPESAPGSIRSLNANSLGITGSLPPGIFVNGLIVSNFSNNNLSGNSPADLRNMRNVRNLRWEDNNLTGQWPDLDWTNQQNFTNSAGEPTHPLRNLSRAQFRNNKYVFADMLVISDEGKTLWQWYRDWFDQQEAAGISTQFNYAPQKKFGSRENLSGGIIDFRTIVTHEDNRYTWYRDGQPISGESSAVINVSNFGLGTYKLEVTNPNVPDLTLESVDIVVSDVNDDSDNDNNDPTPPDSPEPLNPENGSENISPNPVFDWMDVNDVTGYELQVAGDSGFLNLAVNRLNITNSEASVSGLEYETGYFWRVRAVNDAGSSEWSDAWFFTTEPEPVPVPDVPELVSPARNAEGLELNVTLNWEASTGANTYQVQLSETSGFGSRIFE
ncbi:MAG: fibronectin type III domain-containing protein, partial [Balneolaceae bacterium]